VDLNRIGQNARQAFFKLSRSESGTRQSAVSAIAEQITANFDEIKLENENDIQEAKRIGLPEHLIDRLTLSTSRLESLISDLHSLASLPDPIGTVFDERILPNGLKVYRRRVPIGVLGVIYESRPNVTIDVAALAIKTGNTVILRGGKETIESNKILVKLVQSALKMNGLPEESVQFISNPNRELVRGMLHLNEFIDAVIPRGSNSLHQFCRNNSTIPVITGGIGICHLYVDKEADLEAALPLIYNAKTQRPSVCNSLDTLLVNASIAANFLPQVVDYLSNAGVKFKADDSAYQLLDHPSVERAEQGDFDIEWLSLVLGLKVVSDLETAISHIHQHSTQHSDGIITSNMEHANRFVDEVDSAAVYVNASTRFTDGGQLGLGAEVAVSTQRLHARGPMGLPELTTYKWVIQGNYTIRE
jgi:glutamate-5-semialdehyde dehydrogenase